MEFVVDQKIDSVVAQSVEAAAAAGGHHMHGNFAVVAAGADLGLDCVPQLGFHESSELRFAVIGLAVTIGLLEMTAGKTYSDSAGTGEEIGWDVSPSPANLVKQQMPLFEIYQVVGPIVQGPALVASRVSVHNLGNLRTACNDLQPLSGAT